MMYQGPKWHNKLDSMGKIIKGLSSQQGKNDGRPKSIKKYLSPRPMKEQALETKEKKEEAQPAKNQKIKMESSDKKWAGIPRNC